MKGLTQKEASDVTAGGLIPGKGRVCGAHRKVTQSGSGVIVTKGCGGSG